MRLLLQIVAAGAVALALLAPAAADDAKVEEARMHYQNAEKAMEEGRFAGAAAEYIAAYEIMGDAVLFFKIATAYDQAGDCEQALVYYRRYLRQGSPTEQFKTTTEERIAACSAASTTGTTADPDPVPDPDVPPGPGPDTVPDPDPDPDPVPDPDPDADPSFLDEKPSIKKSAGWVLMGTTVVLATAGTILALSGQSREEDIQSLADYRDPQGLPAAYDGTVADRYADLVDEGDRFNTYAKVAFVAAGVTAVASVTLLVLDSAGSKESASGSAISRTLQRVTPVLGRGHAGLAAAFDF